mmetsp:Transcript_32596/g.61327  ORF Transcript_32596/g.61327 Transcript_32596/m.61327 type:complete len:117 (-) Transcript_32596:11-361(-)
MAAPTQRRKSLRSLLVSPESRARAKAATAARQEFYDTVCWSDIFLFVIIVVFSVLGNVYPPTRRFDMYVGMGAFLASFCVYLCIKSCEKAAKRGDSRAEPGEAPASPSEDVNKDSG